jgi:tRNA A-37 threonylcarbamoyl transferase component Bud32
VTAAGEEPLERFEASNMEWTAESPSAAAVRDQIAARLDALEGAPGVELIKRNMVRAVMLAPLEASAPDVGPRVIVKRYAVGGALDWVKYTFRPSRAKTEWRIARALHAAGIPTAVPIAMAERRGIVLEDAALVTREIPDALHLNAYVEAHLQGDPEADRRRTALYDRLGRTVRRMHAAGFVHNDLHGGNILLTGDPEQPEIRIIDLHSVAGPGRSSAAARWFDLVKLLHSMLTCSSVAERTGICSSYEDEGGPSGTEVTVGLKDGSLAARLEPRLAAMELKRVRSRTVRCLDRSSRFDVSKGGGLRIHHLRTLSPKAIVAAIQAHCTVMQTGDGDILKDARRSALTRQSLETDAGVVNVIVKEYLPGTLVQRLKNAFRRPRPVAAWLGGNGLRVRGFDVAEPLALVLTGRGPTLGPCFLLMEDLGDRSRLDLVALERFAGTLDADGRAQKRALLLASADLFRRLHAQGVYHGDLKAVNLFVRVLPSGPSIALADYDRVEFDAAVPERRRIKNLGQVSASVAVCISLADRLRFFRAYAAEDAAAASGWKRWFGGVIAACRQKIVVHMDPIE